VAEDETHKTKARGEDAMPAFLLTHGVPLIVLPPLLSRYDAKQELRRQLGYMSGDMDTLIASTSDKKTGLSMKKDFFTAVDNLDFAIRKKDKDSGLKYQADAVAKLNDFISFAT